MRVLLPEILSTRREGSAKASLRLRLPQDLLYFMGHFPSSPILPGVAQLDWAVHFGKELFPLRGEFKSMEALKFQQVLQPLDEVQLEFEFRPEKGSLGFRYFSPRGRHSSGTLFFG